MTDLQGEVEVGADKILFYRRHRFIVTGLSVNLFAVTDAYDMDGFFGMVNFIDDAVVTYPAGITTAFVPFERFTLVRVVRKRIDSFDYGRNNNSNFLS